MSLRFQSSKTNWHTKTIFQFLSEVPVWDCSTRGTVWICSVSLTLTDPKTNGTAQSMGKCSISTSVLFSFSFIFSNVLFVFSVFVVFFFWGSKHLLRTSIFGVPDLISIKRCAKILLTRHLNAIHGSLWVINLQFGVEDLKHKQKSRFRPRKRCWNTLPNCNLIYHHMYTRFFNMRGWVHVVPVVRRP